MGDEQHLFALEDRLRVKASQMKADRATVNELQSKELCLQLVETLWTRAKMDAKEFTSSEDLEKDVAIFKESYARQALGPGKEEVLRAFLEKKMHVIVTSCFSRVKSLHHETVKLSNELKSAETRHAKELAKAETSINEHSSALRARTTQLEDAQAKLQSLQESAHKMEKASQEQIFKITRDAESNVKSLEAHSKVVP